MAVVEDDKPRNKVVKTYPNGYFHIAMAEVLTLGGEFYLYVIIDRTSKAAFLQVVQDATCMVTA